MDRPVVIVSNRGPLSFRRDNGDLAVARGAGGLVSGLAPLAAGSGALWVAAAMSPADREAAAQGIVEAHDLRVRLVPMDDATYRQAYDVVSNQALWFVLHGLYDLPRQPSFGRDLRDAWAAYGRFNAAFADAVAADAPRDAVVLVQDYHLTLLGQALAERRPDVTAVHFSHTPFATPDWLRVLPGAIAGELLSELAAHAACGFHTQRWADDFRACCAAWQVPAPPTFVSPLPADADDMRRAASSSACDKALERIDEVVGERLVVARVDRIELSKNLLRGFQAFDRLLEREADWRGRVVFVASVYPSRTGVPAYQRYQDEVERLVDEINARWGSHDWTPIVYDTRDDFATSVAVLRRADVLLVNPLRDGLNLVAKEGAIVNQRDAVLCLSPEAGVWSELGEAALPVHPFDIAGTAEVLDQALRLPTDERRQRAEVLRRLATARQPSDWLADQLAAADRADRSPGA